MMWKSLPDENIYQTCGAIAKKYNAFGILSDDTSFLCMQNMPDNLQIYSTDSLNLETLQTIKYDSRVLARYFGIQVEDLPLLATLKGNDIIHFKSLKNFHQTQLGLYLYKIQHSLSKYVQLYSHFYAKDLSFLPQRIIWISFAK